MAAVDDMMLCMDSPQGMPICSVNVRYASSNAGTSTGGLFLSSESGISKVNSLYRGDSGFTAHALGGGGEIQSASEVSFSGQSSTGKVAYTVSKAFSFTNTKGVLINEQYLVDIMSVKGKNITTNCDIPFCERVLGGSFLNMRNGDVASKISLNVTAGKTNLDYLSIADNIAYSPLYDPVSGANLKRKVVPNLTANETLTMPTQLPTKKKEISFVITGKPSPTPKATNNKNGTKAALGAPTFVNEESVAAVTQIATYYNADMAGVNVHVNDMAGENLTNPRLVQGDLYDLTNIYSGDLSMSHHFAYSSDRG